MKVYDDLITNTPITLSAGVPGIGKILTSDVSGVGTWETQYGSASYVVDGQGYAISTGNYTEIKIPYNCTISSFYVHSIDSSTGSDLSGNIVIDILRSGVSIIGAGNKPTLAAAASATGAPTSWTSTTLTADDNLVFFVSSVNTIKKVYCTLKLIKT